MARPKLNRRRLQRLCDIRVREAEALLRARKPDGAYYLLGYALECALKACIAKTTKRYEFPDKDFARDCYTHKLAEFIVLAGLKQEFDRERNRNPQFDLFWGMVKDWSEEHRYEVGIGLPTARNFHRATTHATNGILPWIKQRW